MSWTAVAHLLAATLLWFITGHDDFRSGLQNLTRVVPRPGTGVLPAGIDELTARVEQVPGVRFGEVFADLLPNNDDRAKLFTEIADFSQRYFFIVGGRPQQRRPQKQRRQRRKRR